MTSRPRSALPSLLGLAATIVACSSSEGGDQPPADTAVADAGADAVDPLLPPRVCKPPGAPSSAWFVDATADVGLAAGGAITPLASVVVSADLDGDGWSDLVATAGPGDRPTKQVSFLYLNRPDPTDGTKRTFVESSAGSGLDTTRDGAGNRGYGLAVLGDLDNDGDSDAILCPAWVGADSAVSI
ncbi:MAG: VCBS repeat-containing protein, partial [Polyangiales bacterium]